MSSRPLIPLAGRRGRIRRCAVRILALALTALLGWYVVVTDPAREARPMQATTVSARPPAIVITDLAYYSDDSVALLMLLEAAALDFKAIVTTAGNTDAGRSAKDTLRLLAETGHSGIPVIAGPSMAWYADRRRFYEAVERPSWPRPSYVGAFGERVSGEAPPVNAEAEMEAARFIVDAAKESAGKLIVILQGPATVLAQALRMEPELRQSIAGVYAMGGSLDAPGNVTAHAEFNVWFDPEAMAALLSSGLRLTLVPLDATQAATYVSMEKELTKGQGPIARYLTAYLGHRGADRRSVPMWDEVLAALVLDPSIEKAALDQVLRVTVEKDAEYGRLTVAGASTAGHAAPAHVVVGLDVDRLRRLLVDILASK
jgi:inosine-uridine nucleoside N-ribohydrolase